MIKKIRPKEKEGNPDIPTRTDTLKASFMPNTVKEWNQLPSEIITKSKAAKSQVESFAAMVKGGYMC